MIAKLKCPYCKEVFIRTPLDTAEVQLVKIFLLYDLKEHIQADHMNIFDIQYEGAKP